MTKEYKKRFFICQTDDKEAFGRYSCESDIQKSLEKVKEEAANLCRETGKAVDVYEIVFRCRCKPIMVVEPVEWEEPVLPKKEEKENA